MAIGVDPNTVDGGGAAVAPVSISIFSGSENACIDPDGVEGSEDLPTGVD